jgi:hypothetical protein
MTMPNICLFIFTIECIEAEVSLVTANSDKETGASAFMAVSPSHY